MNLFEKEILIISGFSFPVEYHSSDGKVRSKINMHALSGTECKISGWTQLFQEISILYRKMFVEERLIRESS